MELLIDGHFQLMDREIGNASAKRQTQFGGWVSPNDRGQGLKRHRVACKIAKQPQVASLAPTQLADPLLRERESWIFVCTEDGDSFLRLSRWVFLVPPIQK